MSDPMNWKVGDVIESIDPYVAPVGSLAKITDIKDGIIYDYSIKSFAIVPKELSIYE